MNDCDILVVFRDTWCPKYRSISFLMWIKIKKGKNNYFIIYSMCFKDICKNTVTGILNLKKQLPDRLFAIFVNQ